LLFEALDAEGLGTLRRSDLYSMWHTYKEEKRVLEHKESHAQGSVPSNDKITSASTTHSTTSGGPVKTKERHTCTIKELGEELKAMF